MKTPFRFHYVAIPILAVLGMIGLTVACVAPGCTDAQIQKFEQPTTQPGPSTQPTSQPTTQPGPSVQTQVLNGIDTAQGFISVAGQVASAFPGSTSATVGLILGLVGAAFGVGRKFAANPPKTWQEAGQDILQGVEDVAGKASAIPGAAKVAGQVVAGAKIGEVVLNASQAPTVPNPGPTPPNTPAA